MAPEMKKPALAGIGGCLPDWLLAVIVKPFAALAFFMMIYAMKVAFIRYVPESGFKRLLLSPIFKSKQAGDR